jgi:hypothetical protein
MNGIFFIFKQLYNFNYKLFIDFSFDYDTCVCTLDNMWSIEPVAMFLILGHYCECYRILRDDTTQHLLVLLK